MGAGVLLGQVELKSQGGAEGFTPRPERACESGTQVGEGLSGMPGADGRYEPVREEPELRLAVGVEGRRQAGACDQAIELRAPTQEGGQRPDAGAALGHEPCQKLAQALELVLVEPAHP